MAPHLKGHNNKEDKYIKLRQISAENELPGAPFITSGNHYQLRVYGPPTVAGIPVA